MKNTAPIAATQISHLPQKHAKIEPVFLPKIKIHALAVDSYEICVALSFYHNIS